MYEMLAGRLQPRTIARGPQREKMQRKDICATEGDGGGRARRRPRDC